MYLFLVVLLKILLKKSQNICMIKKKPLPLLMNLEVKVVLILKT